MENKHIFTVMPYRYNDEWVFDDSSVDLDKEPFINGADLLIDRLVEDISLANHGFLLNFSAMPFDGYSVKLDWHREEGNGNWYHSKKFEMDGWLCPALLKYFIAPPKELYVGAKSLHENVTTIIEMDKRLKEKETYDKHIADCNYIKENAWNIEDDGEKSKLDDDVFSIEVPKKVSHFYEQFDNPKNYILLYPEYNEEVHPEGEGPYWLPSGELELENVIEWVHERVSVVELGENKYQLANLFDLSLLRLNWGDIFYAEKDGEYLKLQKIEMPMPYKHYFSLGGAFGNNTPKSDLIHRLNGGWKTFALGCLTVSIPIDKVEEFENELAKLD